MGLGRSHLTDGEKDRICNLYKQGMSTFEISRRVEVSVSTIHKLVKSAGLKKVKMPKEFDAHLTYSCPCCGGQLNKAAHTCNNCGSAFYRPYIHVEYRR